MNELQNNEERNETCPSCGGEGGFYADPSRLHGDIRCTDCNGYGRVTLAKREALLDEFRKQDERLASATLDESVDPFGWYEPK